MVPQSLGSTDRGYRATCLLLALGVEHEPRSGSAFTKRRFHAASLGVPPGLLPGWPLLGGVACGRARGSTVGGPLLVSQTRFPREVRGEDPRAGKANPCLEHTKTHQDESLLFPAQKWSHVTTGHQVAGWCV